MAARAQLIADTARAALRVVANLDWSPRRNIEDSARDFEIALGEQLGGALNSTHEALCGLLRKLRAAKTRFVFVGEYPPNSYFTNGRSYIRDEGGSLLPMGEKSVIRQPAVAGAFYPADVATLRQSLTHLMQPPDSTAAAQRPKALIAPHAGYVYSGRVAGLAYARLAPFAESIRRVVLLGPVHRVAVRGLALPEADRFRTPLGEVAIDQDAVRLLARLKQVVVSGPAHALEHSLEVQLPFLQSALRDFTCVPLAVGDATAEEVAEVLDVLWGGPETLIVISSDLSHYLTYDAARKKDHDTVEKILRGELLDSFDQACGAVPIDGLLQAARRHGLRPRLVSQCNSGDTAGDRQRVVGYAAIEFLENGDGE